MTQCLDKSKAITDGFSVAVSSAACINFAMQQNDIPIVREVRIRNNRSEAVDGLVLRITTEPAVTVMAERPLSLLAPGEEVIIRDLSPRILYKCLALQIEREIGELNAELVLNGVTVSRESQSMEVLAANEWSGALTFPELLAAFILPNQPVVEQLLAEARDILLKNTGGASLNGYQNIDTARILAQVASIYGAIAMRGITYANPPASFENMGQKIRFPDQIMENRLGTCLDLSILYAACLEQAGLHPVVVVFRDHASVAVWLKPETFPGPTLDDPAALRKRIDLGEMTAVEATAMVQTPPLNFRIAQDAGRRGLAECVPGGNSQMLFALDLKMARNAGIRPLPFRGGKIEAYSAHVVSDPADGSADLTAIDSPIAPQMQDLTPQPESSQQRLERWKNRLLDLTRRNRLLNFRETKTVLRLLCPDLALMEDALANGKEFVILPKPSVMGADDPLETDSRLGGSASDQQVKYLREQLGRGRLHSTMDEQDIESRLLEISRVARSNIDETGANTLFLAIGFLRWFENPTDEQGSEAPILLVPLSIKRHSVREGFRVCRLDDEERINVTLLHKLKSDFGLSIPGLDPLPQDEAGLDVNGILARIRDAVKEMPRWDVTNDACICILTFTKFLVWLDLEKNAAAFSNARIARHLIETPNEPFPAPDGPAVPPQEELDDDLAAGSFLCPLDADSSQISAVVAAANGQSFVLEGPPGTGKSQTITNLIIHCLANGKRVLFVSEKAAALNVVHKRLTLSGVAPFCLSLHSARTTREELRGQLDATFKVVAGQPAGDWDTQTRRLEELRTHLNGYVKALHQPRNIGYSIHWAIEQLVHYRETPKCRLEIEPDTMNAALLGKMRDAIAALRIASVETGDAGSHPLREFRSSEWSMTLFGDLRQCMDELFRQIPKLEVAAAPVLELFRLGNTGWSLDILGFAADLTRLLIAAKPVTAALLKNPGWCDAEKNMHAWIEKGRKRDAQRNMLLQNYRESILKIDPAPHIAALHGAASAWFVKRWLLRSRVSRTLASHRRTDIAGNWEEVLAEMDLAAAVQQGNSELAGAAEPARLFNSVWNQGEAQWDKLTAMLNWVHDFRLLIDKHPDPTLQEDWMDLALAGGVPDATAFGSAFLMEHSRYCELRSTLESKVAGNNAGAPAMCGAIWGDPGKGNGLALCAANIERWQKGLQDLRTWCHYRHARDQACGLGLLPLVTELESGRLAPAALEAAFEASFAETWLLNYALPMEPRINQFAGVQHHARIEQFRKLDVAVRDITRDIVTARLAARIPETSEKTEKKRSSEMGRIYRFIRGGRSTIRKIFKECPQALMLLKPCMLMSPLSVAQFLGDGFPCFDLVVFDEASQMPVWDAIGAVARGKQLVVVGDTKQLPPTSFFERKETEDLMEIEVEDMESILDECSASRFPVRRLNWHYRSRHESLIAFSNRRYYGGDLQTFPSSEIDPGRLGVSWREVPNGVYDAGRTRTNRAEAEAVVQEIVQRLGDPTRSHESIGIVTFNMQQQTLIEDLLEKTRHDNPGLDQFFDSELTDEPVFVKNLETVQGDERDVILFSICYGPDANGRVIMNFGPLNKTGGERRLNVAVTRARRQLIVFSTLRSEQIDTTRTQATGVIHLREFMEFARSSGRSSDALSGPQAEVGSITDASVLGSAVSMALTKRGWRVATEVGCSKDYRIDLAVYHPEQSTRYLLGIEFDGPNYRSAKTARDRDRLRASVLAGLGWRLHRIWSGDWWQEPDREFIRLESALNAALQAPHRNDDMVITLTADGSRSVGPKSVREMI